MLTDPYEWITVKIWCTLMLTLLLINQICGTILLSWCFFIPVLTKCAQCTLYWNKILLLNHVLITPLQHTAYSYVHEKNCIFNIIKHWTGVTVGAYRSSPLPKSESKCIAKSKWDASKAESFEGSTSRACDDTESRPGAFKLDAGEVQLFCSL
jgi:hypothetical protein